MRYVKAILAFVGLKKNNLQAANSFTTSQTIKTEIISWASIQFCIYCIINKRTNPYNALHDIHVADSMWFSIVGRAISIKTVFY